MHQVETDDVRLWYAEQRDFNTVIRSIGQKRLDGEYLERVLGLPRHLSFLMEKLDQETGGLIPNEALQSLPFYSLCKGLFLPLSGLTAERAGQIFGILAPSPPDATGREKLLREFLEKPIGLSMMQKLGCILGDPFYGRKSTLRRDSLLRLLTSLMLLKRNEVLDRLTRVGDVAILYAESRPWQKVEPLLSAAEVLETLTRIPDERKTLQFDLLRSLLERMSRLEAYFLAKLLLRKAGFGFDYQGALLAEIVAGRFKVPAGQVAHAMALTDPFRVVRGLEEEGAESLRRIQLRPLVPVRPALASNTVDTIEKFPVWVERKYDGIRLMLHKSTDASGATLCGAYTRNRHDWLELVPGLDVTIRMFAARNVIVDGELYGTIVDVNGIRPASVYEVYAALQGEASRPVQMKFAAFDMLYWEGNDLTQLPLSDRRQRLLQLMAPMQFTQTPVPVTVAEGQLANHKDDLNRLYHHFRSQGYEGIIAKDLAGPYRLADRDPTWTKRKPEVTLDLVLIGAVLAVTTKEYAGAFGSYVIAARKPDGGFDDVGDVAGLDKQRDQEIQSLIVRDGLATGKRIERPSSSGVRPGFELRPSIVVTVKFEGITRDQVNGELSLRDPKLVVIRSDKQPHEADDTTAIEELALRQRVG